MESASRQAVSEELNALGSLPSEAELGALIERYAGSRRVTCEQADLFFASIGEATTAAKPARKAAAPGDAAEVARGSWLDKLGPRSSAPPRAAAASAQPPALSIAAVPSVHPPEEPITIEQALEHLPATTYSSAPPPSALPSEDSAPVALPLSSHPAPQLAAADSVVVERWGMAETTPEPPPLATVAAGEPDDAEEAALLDRWSDELDQAIAASEHPAALGATGEHVQALAGLADQPEPGLATDAPARWSAPHLGGETEDPKRITHDDDAPLSAAELSLLDQWSSEEQELPAAEVSAEKSAPPTAAASEPAAAADTRRSSRAPKKRTMPPPFRGASLRPTAAATQPPAFAVNTAKQDDAELDVELEDEIELDPDDLMEIDSE